MCVKSADTLQAVGHCDFTFRITYFLFTHSQQHLMLFECHPIKNNNNNNRSCFHTADDSHSTAPLRPLYLYLFHPEKQLSWAVFFSFLFFLREQPDNLHCPLRARLHDSPCLFAPWCHASMATVELFWAGHEGISRGLLSSFLPRAELTLSSEACWFPHR